MNMTCQKANELPPGWCWATTGECVDSQVGRAFKSADFRADGVNLLRGDNIGHGSLRWSDGRRKCIGDDALRDHAHLQLKDGDIVLAMDRPVISTGLKHAKVRASDLPALLVQRVARLRPRIKPSYFHYTLLTAAFIRHLQSEARGGGVPHVSEGQIRAFRFPLAPLPEQERIVAEIEKHFSRLDDAVASLERVKAKLKRARASVLKAAVEGRLVPTEAELAKAEGRTYEPAADLLKRILTERSSKHDEAQAEAKRKKKYLPPAEPDTKGLPVLPQGWVWCRVDAAGEVKLGRQRSPKDHSGTHMRPYLRVANVFEDRLDLSDVKEMNFTPDEFEVYQLQCGDILLNEGQSPHLVGRPAMWRGEIEGACFQNTLVRWRSFSPSDVVPKFALVVFRAQLHTRRYMEIAKLTTNIAHLGAGRFAAVEFPLPPKAEQRRIVSEVERRLSVLDAAELAVERNLTRCTNLRQSILKRAFEGRLVPQDPSDEPASALLARIQAQTASSESTPS